MVVEKMLAPPEFYRGFHSLVHQRNRTMSGARISPRRCLFGSPDPKDTIRMLKEVLEAERARFIRLWGVDPFAAGANDELEDRTVTWVIRVDKNRKALTKLTPSKRVPNRPANRNLGPCSNYKQTVIQDFLRVRKNSEGSAKKSPSDETTTSTSPSSADAAPAVDDYATAADVVDDDDQESPVVERPDDHQDWSIN